MHRVSYTELFEALRGALVKLGFEAARAELCARLFAETTCDGVYSHGVNRFPRFVRTIKSGKVKIGATPALTASRGALERWDGRRGPGNLNAHAAMARAMELARAHGLGCVALANTNHWMRGGSYGWQAADAGMIGMCWTNTLPNLPPWGASEPLLGNNPLVIAVPRAAGHVVLDMAMSQFSYGALESYAKRGEQLPVPGGFDEQGHLTRDAAAIEKTQRTLPIGYWKGSGLALVLDLVAGLLSGGQFTHTIERDPEKESGLSQVFLAFDAGSAGAASVASRVDEVIEQIASRTEEKGEQVRYPGQQVLATRRENLEKGIPVAEPVWEQVRALNQG
ncbi:MAG TPA: 3-dehydro-L-gulonate 2-dehydrogenase [Candidatus Acidoferrales bacterium]|nr:3-dehydro-L-gulonate 2-dehydrogenase [Candidatus Acidoferrales bacterium]